MHGVLVLSELPCQAAVDFTPLISHCRYTKTYDYLEGELRARLELQKDGLYLVGPGGLLLCHLHHLTCTQPPHYPTCYSFRLQYRNMIAPNVPNLHILTLITHPAAPAPCSTAT